MAQLVREGEIKPVSQVYEEIEITAIVVLEQEEISLGSDIGLPVETANIQKRDDHITIQVYGHVR